MGAARHRRHPQPPAISPAAVPPPAPEPGPAAGLPRWPAGCAGAFPPWPAAPLPGDASCSLLLPCAGVPAPGQVLVNQRLEQIQLLPTVVEAGNIVQGTAPGGGKPGLVFHLDLLQIG